MTITFREKDASPAQQIKVFLPAAALKRILENETLCAPRSKQQNKNAAKTFSLPVDKLGTRKSVQIHFLTTDTYTWHAVRGFGVRTSAAQ